MALIITNAGIDAAKRADNMGLDCKVAFIAIGTAGYIPDKTQLALKNEILRKPVTSGSAPLINILNFQIQIDGDISYEGKEIGYYFEDGTLFAVDSRDGDVISIKLKNSIVTEAFELNLADSEIKNITVTFSESLLATEQNAGIAKIASKEDVVKGVDDSSFITPKKLNETKRNVDVLTPLIVILNKENNGEHRILIETGKHTDLYFDYEFKYGGNSYGGVPLLVKMYNGKKLIREHCVLYEVASRNEMLRRTVNIPITEDVNTMTLKWVNTDFGPPYITNMLIK